jgi:hypothetical protein
MVPLGKISEELKMYQIISVKDKAIPLTGREGP